MGFNGTACFWCLRAPSEMKDELQDGREDRKQDSGILKAVSL